MLPSFSNISLQLLILTNLSNLTNASDPRAETVVFRLSKDCKPNYIRLDNYDKLEVTSNVIMDEPSPVEDKITCTSHFMTGQTNHGICIRNNDLYFRPTGPKIMFYTTKMEPEKVLRHGLRQDFGEWCTRESLITMEISTSGAMRNQDDEYRYSFNVYNVSQEQVKTTYYLDSFRYCNLSYQLTSGEELVVITQRDPPTASLPQSCQIYLSTEGSDEYEALCVTLERYEMNINCHSKLEVTGFMDRFWPKTESLGCNDHHSVLKKEEMCSDDKRLVLAMTRANDTDMGFYARAIIKSKKHPKWETLSQESVELQGLGFMKGLTFFIATIDTLATMLAAVLATMIRNPQGFWKEWVDSMKTASTCEAVHYHVSYPEPSSDRVEEITEAKPY